METTNTNSNLIPEILKTHELAVYMTDKDGKIYVWNSKASELFGYSEKEILGQPDSVFYPDSLEKFSPAGERYGWRIRKDGSSIFVRETISKITDAENPEVCYMKIIEDVADHLTPRDKSELWITQYEYAPWGVSISDAQKDTLEMMNLEFATMHGYSPEELIGQPVSIVYSKAAYKELESRLKEIERTGRYRFQSEHVRKDGSTFPVSIDSTTIRDNKGKIAYRAAHVANLEVSSGVPEGH